MSDPLVENFERYNNAFLGSLEAQRRAHDTLQISSDAARTAMTAAIGGIATVTTPASLADAQDAIPGLLDDIVVTHVLRSDYFDDPADLARLPAVSRAMRDAVAGTGRRFAELGERRAVELGCLSAVQRLQRRGLLSRQEYLSGSGEEWTARRVAGAARGRLAVGLKHVRVRGKGRARV
jgi:hypothetical protein